MTKYKILKKHLKLASMLRKNVTFDEVRNYISKYRKYDSWTYRDIDKVVFIKNPCDQCSECDVWNCECCGEKHCGEYEIIDCMRMIEGVWYCDNSRNCANQKEDEVTMAREEGQELEKAIKWLWNNKMIDSSTDDYGDTAEDHIRENYKTGGRASRQLWYTIQINDLDELNHLLGCIGVAHIRHTQTDYDSIDKRNMTDEQVAELRREYN